MELIVPEEIEALVKSTSWTNDSIGMSESEIFLSEEYVLKISPSSCETENELSNYRDLAYLGIFPEAVYNGRFEKTCVLLTRRIVGVPLNALEPNQIVPTVARVINQLKDIELSCLMMDQSLDKKLSQAEFNVKNGDVDMEHWDDDLQKGRFQTPIDLLIYLQENRPNEELVFSHGDLTFENIMVTEDGAIKYIDIGKTGISDIYQDIALLTRSCNYYFGENKITDIEQALGKKIDVGKLEYYMLLDELS